MHTHIVRLGITAKHIQLAQRLNLDFMFLMCHELNKVFVWVNHNHKDLTTLLPKTASNKIKDVIHDAKTGDVSMTIHNIDQSLVKDVVKILETFNKVIMGTLQKFKVEIMSRGSELYVEDLSMIFNTGNRLVYYERDEISKHYQVYCPLDAQHNASSPASSLKLFPNLPISVLILGQTTKPKFNQRG
jgi:hypothetical protein